MFRCLLTVTRAIGREVPCQVLATAIARHARNTNTDCLAASFLNIYRFVPPINLRFWELALLLDGATWIRYNA